MPHLALSLERFAELSAAMDAGEPREELLAREGLSLEVWLEAQAGWLSMMSAEVSRQRFEINQRYQAVYAARQPQLIGIAPTDEAPADDVDGTGIALEINWGEAMPFEGEGPAPVDDKALTLDDAGDTGFVSPLNIVPATPFDPKPEPEPEPAVAPVAPAVAAPVAPAVAAPVAPAPPVAPPSPPKSESELDHTGFVSAIDFGDALPFQGDAAATPASAADEIQAEGAALAGETSFVAALTDEELAAPSTSSIDSTGEMGALSNIEAVPFEPAGQAQAPTPAAQAKARPDLVGETAFVSAVHIDDDALPFEAAHAPPAPAATSLTLEQYASLSVELGGCDAAMRAATLSKYGVADEGGFAQLRATFDQQLQTDAALQTRFRNACIAYQQWLASQRG